MTYRLDLRVFRVSVVSQRQDHILLWLIGDDEATLETKVPRGTAKWWLESNLGYHGEIEHREVSISQSNFVRKSE